jgi:hypothetical protein
MTITKSERAALAILAGCPTGSTEHNLVTRHDVKQTTLYRLVERGLIRPEERKIRPPWNWPITWVLITAAGHEALKAKRGKQ